MKKIMLRLVIVPLLSSLLLSNILQLHTIMSAPVEMKQQEITKAAKQWQEQLAEQTNFAQWKEASLSISALGPGTHGWLVLIKQKNEVIGYMIIHALEQGGFSLSEYGSGDPASLQLIIDHTESLTYYGPFHSIITLAADGTDAYIEPFLQEEFPIEATTIEQVENQYTQIGQGASKQPALITGVDSINYFSPYDLMPWLTTDPLNDSFEDDTSIEVMIELGSQLRYTTESWNHCIFSAYSITGYHKWNEFDLYIALQGENEQLTRYIPYDTLMAEGLFYDRATY